MRSTLKTYVNRTGNFPPRKGSGSPAPSDVGFSKRPATLGDGWTPTRIGTFPEKNTPLGDFVAAARELLDGSAANERFLVNVINAINRNFRGPAGK